MNRPKARADHSFEVAFWRYLAPDLIVLDDFGLHRLSEQEPEDLYALIIERHPPSDFVVTSNREVSEWGGFFADLILLLRQTGSRLTQGVNMSRLQPTAVVAFGGSASLASSSGITPVIDGESE